MSDNYKGVECFLDKNEKKTLQRMYQTWNNTLKSKIMVDSMYEFGYISSNEKQDYIAKKTEHERCEYLFDLCLMRSTYTEIQQVRQILVDSNIDAHMCLARMLPVRDSDDFWKTFDAIKSPQPCTSQSEEKHDKSDENVNIQAEPMDTGNPNTNIPPQQSNQPENGNFPTTSNSSSASPAARADPSTYAPQDENAAQYNPHRPPPGNSMLMSYDTKSPRLPNGNGYVLIIANYTNDGVCINYEKDIQGLEMFFTNTLKYEVMIKKNLRKADINQLLLNTQKKLQTSNFDRFFCYIMSHGEERGIKTCNSDGETDEGLIITADEIVNKFTHDKVGSLRGYPKVFFIQACAGEQIAQAAGDGSSNTVKHDMIAMPAAKAEKITIGADILICHSTKQGQYAWIDERGSWLIQQTLEVFKDYYEREHLLDMLTEVIQRISKKCMVGLAQNQHQSARQLPVVTHSLTRKLYFVRQHQQNL